MRLHVRHATTYVFDQPKRFVVQSHRLTPSGSTGQKVLDWRVTAEGAAFGASFIDGAGDRVSTMTAHGPVSRIEILVEGLVETTDTSGVLRGVREVISPRAYLRSTPATKANGALTVLKDEALARAGDADELARAHLLCAAVSDAISYRPGSTDAHTTAAEALEQGEGVCQDHAHALIALAHAADLPARYVTGYLLAGDEEGVGEASHAWAEIHVTGLGWVGFDASNRCCPDPRYIRLGSGRDALAAAPIRGMSRGGGEEAMDVSVVVATAGPSQGQTQQ
jgi:transglutaminase-like putative cysteine protease